MNCLLYYGDEYSEIVPVHARKAYGGAEIKLHSFLTSALYGG